MQNNEDDFLQQLLSGMGSNNASQSLLISSSAAPPPPTLPTPPTQCSQATEMETLLDGAEDWDWDGDLEESLVTEAIPAQVSRRVQTTTSAFFKMKPFQRLPEKVLVPAADKRHVISPYFRCIVDSIADSTLGKREKVSL